MSYVDPSPGLPDPDQFPEFYSGVTAKRFFAWLIDLIIVAIMTVVGVLMTAFIGLFFLPVIWLTCDFIYRTTCLARGSSTFGHRVMGIEFRDRDGRRLDLAQAGLLSLGYMVSYSFLLPGIISVVMILASSRRQSLTDMLLGTAAINRPASHV